MEVLKASDVLAEELRERILSGEFVDDTQLPPERDLVTQTQMSRSTVREALRILGVQGLVRISPAAPAARSCNDRARTRSRRR